MVVNEKLIEKASKIKLVLTDCDGVLTDAGVYYSEGGEILKKFSLRDGMGVERLRNTHNIETGIITGENSEIVKRRAEKLKLKILYLGIKDKFVVLEEIATKYKYRFSEIAYIGDDVNDLPILSKCGLKACPNNAMIQVREYADYVTPNNGGAGAFRDLAELIIYAKTIKIEEKIYEQY